MTSSNVYYVQLFLSSKYCREEDNTNTAARSASHVVLHSGMSFKKYG